MTFILRKIQNKKETEVNFLRTVSKLKHIFIFSKW